MFRRPCALSTAWHMLRHAPPHRDTPTMVVPKACSLMKLGRGLIKLILQHTYIYIFFPGHTKNVSICYRTREIIRYTGHVAIFEKIIPRQSHLENTYRIHRHHTTLLTKNKKRILMNKKIQRMNNSIISSHAIMVFATTAFPPDLNAHHPSA